MWARIRDAHFGYEAGNELLGVLFMLAEKVRFFELRVENNLEVTIPEHLNDPELQARMKKVLAPPPATKADEIAAICGGMYYLQEAPGLPPFVHAGMHFEKGQPLYIIEVMKMFNTVRAPSPACWTASSSRRGGTIVHKGSPLQDHSDEKFVETDLKAVERERRSQTNEYLRAVL